MTVFYQKKTVLHQFCQTYDFFNIDVSSNIIMFYQNYQGFNKCINVLLRTSLFYQKY